MFSCISSFHSTIILPTTSDNWMPSIIIIQVLFLGDASVGNVLGQVTWTTDRADVHAGSLSGVTSVRHWRKQVWTQRQAERQWSNNTGLNGGPRAGVGPEGLSQTEARGWAFLPYIIRSVGASHLGGFWTGICPLPKPPPLPASKIKQTFLSTSLGFWAASNWTWIW